MSRQAADADDVVDLGQRRGALRLVCAKQPVRMTRRCGLSRRARRASCRLSASARSVTVQEFTTYTSAPAANDDLAVGAQRGLHGRRVVLIDLAAERGEGDAERPFTRMTPTAIHPPPITAPRRTTPPPAPASPPACRPRRPARTPSPIRPHYAHRLRREARADLHLRARSRPAAPPPAS